MNNLVTIIIPVYNGEKYIAQAANSALAQDYQPIEILVIDDGSSDATPEILSSFHQKITYVQQHNSGVSAARNRGLELSQGSYILFLDADDYLLANTVGDQVKALAGNSQLDVVQSGWQVVDQDGEPIRSVEPWHETPRLNLVSWLHKKPLALGALMFRKELLVRASGFDPKLAQAEDVDLVLRLFQRGARFGWHKAVTVAYRQHHHSIRRRGWEQAESLSSVIDRFYAQEHLPLRVKAIKRKVKYNTYVWLAWHVSQSNGNSDQIRHLLERALDYSFFSNSLKLTMLDWQRKIADYAQQAGCEPQVIMNLWDPFQEIAGQHHLAWEPIHQCLNAWCEFWYRSATLDDLATPEVLPAFLFCPADCQFSSSDRERAAAYTGTNVLDGSLKYAALLTLACAHFARRNLSQALEIFRLSLKRISVRGNVLFVQRVIWPVLSSALSLARKHPLQILGAILPRK